MAHFMYTSAATAAPARSRRLEVCYSINESALVYQIELLLRHGLGAVDHIKAHSQHETDALDTSSRR